MTFPFGSIGLVSHVSVFLAVISSAVKAPLKLTGFMESKLNTGTSATFFRAKLMFNEPSFLSQIPTSPISVMNTNFSLTTINCRNLKWKSRLLLFPDIELTGNFPNKKLISSSKTACYFDNSSRKGDSFKFNDISQAISFL